MDPTIIAAIIGATALIITALIGVICRPKPPPSNPNIKEVEVEGIKLEEETAEAERIKVEEEINPAEVSKRPAWQGYEPLFEIDEYQLAYIPIINDWRREGVVSDFSWTDIKVSLDDKPFKLLSSFERTQLPSDFRDDPRCRLSSCELHNQEKFFLSLHLQQTSYGDYLKSGEHLDDPFPDDPRETFRSELGSIVNVGSGKVKPENLTNICGFGIFIITKDKKIIIAKHSDASHVYPGRLSFSASGVMNWGAYPNPFMEMARKTYHEIHFQVTPDNVRLIGFGADARTLYFQFSFVEEVAQEASEIVAWHESARNREKEQLKDSLQELIMLPSKDSPQELIMLPFKDSPQELIMLPFNLTNIRDAVINSCWEPAAEACLLTLCAKEFGAEAVARALHGRHNDWVKREMRDEWDYRASKKGCLPDRSVRYDREKLEEGNDQYVDAVFKFMNTDINGKDIVEIGAGTGQITKRLVDVATRLTCIDLCEKMIKRNQETLNNKLKKKMSKRNQKLLEDKIKRVEHSQKFGQEYRPTDKHEVAVCSLVLIHNVTDYEFNRLVESISNCANTLFVFEDVTQERSTSQATKLRTADQLIAAFRKCGFTLERRRNPNYPLFEDQIAFLKFVTK